VRIVLAILLFITCEIKAQAILEESNLKAVINPIGKLFGPIGVEFPKNESKYCFGESVLWLSGVNKNDTFISANQLGNSVSDFQAGPISNNGQSGSMEAKWNTVYSISKSQINTHRSNFGKEGYMLPESIEKWHANGEQGFTKLLAPFADWNNNEIYEPTQGDYPYIYGDQMAYTVFNDRGAHGLTGGSGMGVQVENLVSVYGAYGDQARNNLLINRVLVTNKSNKIYSNYKLSILNKFILGDDQDNFVGTDAKNNFIYCYNSSNNDASYGQSIPALIVFPLSLEDTILSSIYTTNNQDAQTGIPNSKKEYYNYALGLWRNGKSLAYGGSGLDGATPCKYVYSGTTDESINGSDWNELDVGNNGGERTMLMNLDLDSLKIGELKVVSIAYAVLDNYTGNVEDILSLVKKVRENHLDGWYTSDLEMSKSLFIYPTITKVGSKVKIDVTMDSHSVVNLYDSKGIRVQEIRNLKNNCIILKDGLVSGLYFMEFRNFKGVYYTKLIIQ